MMRVHWTTDYSGAVGNSLGYATHNDGMRAALVATGVTLDVDAPIAMHVVPGHRFEPIPGKLNVVSTAWEAYQLPELWRTTLAAADAILPTAEFLVAPLRAMFPDKLVERLSLGVDTELFSYVNRNHPKYRPWAGGRPFRFLYLGAPNARKGGLHALEAWKPFASNETMELYVKTTDAAVRKVERHGNIIYDTRKLPLGELVKLYHRAHCLLYPSIGEGFGLCVHPSTMLELDGGDTVRIKDVKYGDRVLVKDGTYQKVRTKTSRRVSELFKVRVANIGTVYVTKEHPFLSCVSGKYSRGKTLAWRTVDELSTGNCIAIPKAKLERPLPNNIDLAEIACVEADVNSVWFKMGYSPTGSEVSLSGICSKYGETKKVAENAVACVRGSKTMSVGSRASMLAERLISDGYEPPTPKRYNRYIEIDGNALEFVGWYIAEGSARDRACLELSCGRKDVLHLIKLVKWCRNNGGVVNVICNNKRPNSIRVSVCHGPLATWLLSACGDGAHNKRIPEEFFRSAKFIKPLIRGLFLGDGSGSGGCEWSLTTASRTLAYQVRRVLSCWGISSGVTRRRKLGHYTVRVGGRMADKLSRVCRLPLRRQNNHKTARRGAAAYDIGDYILVPIRSIQRIPFNGFVHDIEVPGSGSFIGNGMVLHNTAAEAAATGLPAIYTPETAMLDTLPTDLRCGYPLKFEWTDADWSWKDADARGTAMNVKVRVANPDTNNLAELIADVVLNPQEAFARGLRAANHVRSNFTWQRCGMTLRQILNGVMDHAGHFAAAEAAH